MLDALDGDGLVDAAVADDALVRAMLDVESALARALERAALVPTGSGRAVTAALATLDVDPAELGREAIAAGNPVVPLVRQALAAVPAPARAAVHLGATSQDVLDSALMLCAGRALDGVLAHVERACAAASTLAVRHRDTLMVARTLGQPALPTTFGVKAAGWLAGLEAARTRLEDVRRHGLAAQLGGAAGTLAAYGRNGLQVGALFADEVGLPDPGIPWHTERSRMQVLGASLAQLVAAAGKVATDVLLMTQGEVGEVAEDSPGGSSAMPHKRNPVRSVLVVGAARRSPGLLATLLAAGLHEHERATGSWHAEWAPLRELLRLAGGASARVADVLAGLQVDPDAMRRNLDAVGPGVMSEALAGLLIAPLGRAEAADVARAAVGRAREERTDLGAAAAADPRVAALVDAGRLDAASVASVGDPRSYLGASAAIVDRVLKRATA